MDYCFYMSDFWTICKKFRHVSVACQGSADLQAALPLPVQNLPRHLYPALHQNPRTAAHESMTWALQGFFAKQGSCVANADPCDRPLLRVFSAGAAKCPRIGSRASPSRIGRRVEAKERGGCFGFGQHIDHPWFLSPLRRDMAVVEARWHVHAAMRDAVVGGRAAGQAL